MKRFLTILTAAFIALATYALEVGAMRADLWKPLLEGKRVGLLSNHTGIVAPGVHTVDKMLAEGIEVTTLFSPEHGFRGNAEAGAQVASGRDDVTGLPVVSMYNGPRKGIPADVFDDFDVLVIDLQDVGARFYTYYITMMEAMADCARAGKPVVIFDRPNPLIMTVDGPVLDMSLASGVGKIPVPVIHGLTLGEIALMANGEGWLARGAKVADLSVIPVKDYTRSTRYDLPVAPSPNLPDMQAVLLYPSLCLFEGTPVSLGRGTPAPFTRYGHPAMRNHSFKFTPRSCPAATRPPCMNRECFGTDLSKLAPDTIIARGLDLSYIIDAYRSMPRDVKFFTPFFDRLAGDKALKNQIARGVSPDSIRAGWQPAINNYLRQRQPYLLYPR